MKKGYLVLQDGQVFEGLRFGAEHDTVGELVFTTGMCGYIETLTDPSYAGQIVMQTYPLIGNYGIIREDFEGACCVKGYVVREYCDTPSNFRTDCDLDTYLKEQGVPGLCGVDTRELTRIIREHGVMNAAICDEIPADLTPIETYAVTGVVEAVSCKESSVHPAEGEERFRVSLLDYGAKRNIVRELQKRGCTVTVLPASTSAEEILAAGPDGVMLSNGPGDPAENTYQIEQIRKLLGKVPMFGICLGHQLTALAAGGSTYKLKYGHRGVNQPVRDLNGVRTYITSQNHGYAVDSDTVKLGKVRFANANDGTCEGIDYPELKAFTVQFHPEACTGPIKVFNSIDELADFYKIDRKALRDTIEQYNAAVKSGKDEAFGKPMNVTNGIDVSKPPFYAGRVCPKIHHTMGGVLISPKGEVIHMRTHKPIPGLYAGGEVTGGVHGASRLGTVGIIDALTFGMVAGENI